MSDDRAEITNLVLRYPELIDAGDFEGVADLFKHGEITAEGTSMSHEGREAVLRMYETTTRRYPDDGTPHTKHVNTNLIVDVDANGTDATCRSYFTVLQSIPGELALQPIIAGRYHDTFAKVDGAWHFLHRHMVVDLVGDLSHHLLFELP